MVPATVLEIFYQELASPSYKSPSFGHSYRTRNVLPWFWGKSPTFGHSYRTRDILPWFWSKRPSLVFPTEVEIFYCDFEAKTLLLVIPTEIEIFWQDLYNSYKSSTFGKSLTRLCQKSPTFDYSYSTRNILPNILQIIQIGQNKQKYDFFDKNFAYHSLH